MNPRRNAQLAGDPLVLMHTSLEARCCEPTPIAKDRFRAICPVCGTANRSKLSVARGRHAPLVVRCFAGCEWGDVLDAVGMPWEAALGEGERVVWRRWHARDREAIRQCLDALGAAARWVKDLERGAEGPSPAGPLLLAARLVDDEARRRGIGR